MLLLALNGYAASVQARDFGMSPDAVVLTFDMSGGQKPRIDEVPILTITADGTVTARGLGRGDPPVVSHMNTAEKEEIFIALLDRNGALSISSDAIQAEVTKSGVRVGRVPDAPTTTLSIALPEGSSAITLKGVSALAGQLPNATSLNRLFRIQTLLLDVARQITKSAK
jgi:hypothetical protein